MLYYLPTEAYVSPDLAGINTLLQGRDQIGDSEGGQHDDGHKG